MRHTLISSPPRHIEAEDRGTQQSKDAIVKIPGTPTNLSCMSSIEGRHQDFESVINEGDQRIPC